MNACEVATVKAISPAYPMYDVWFHGRLVRKKMNIQMSEFESKVDPTNITRYT